jgi:type II secretory pathway component PulL
LLLLPFNESISSEKSTEYKEESLSWTIWFDRGSCKVRTKSYDGFSLPMSLAYSHLLTFMDQAKASVGAVYVSPDTHVDWQQFQSTPSGLSSILLRSKINTQLEWKWKGGHFNLLQDQLEAKVVGWWDNRWIRWGVYFWVSVLVLSVGFAQFEIWRLNRQAKGVKAELEKQARLVIPNQAPLLDPVAQVKSLVVRSDKPKENPFEQLLFVANQALGDLPGKITQMDYKQRKLTLTFEKALTEKERQSIQIYSAQIKMEWPDATHLVLTLEQGEKP